MPRVGCVASGAVSKAAGDRGCPSRPVARFLQDNQVQVIAVHHIGPGMQPEFKGSMAIGVVTGLGGDARSAARAAG